MTGRPLALAALTLFLGSSCQLVIGSDSPWPDELADGGAEPADSGVAEDAGGESDAGGRPDAGPSDAGGGEEPDAGPSDAGGGEPDAGQCAPSEGSCGTSQDCCPGLGCAGTVPRCVLFEGPGLPDGYRCVFPGECASGYCRQQLCADPEVDSCRGAASYCGESKPCCTGMLCQEEYPSSCVVMTGEPCAGSMMCPSRNCGDDGLCAPECRPEGASCSEDHSCCSGFCSAGACVPCIATGEPCEEGYHVNCCSKSCWTVCQPPSQ